MTARFQPGDLVIMQHGTYYRDYDGCPAVIVGPLRNAWGLNMATFEYEYRQVYTVHLLAGPDALLSDDNRLLARPDQVRRPWGKEVSEIVETLGAEET